MASPMSDGHSLFEAYNMFQMLMYFVHCSIL